jgi:hypothetical protein
MRLARPLVCKRKRADAANGLRTLSDQGGRRREDK